LFLSFQLAYAQVSQKSLMVIATLELSVFLTNSI
jgi:hypothetical protein